MRVRSAVEEVAVEVAAAVVVPEEVRTDNKPDPLVELPATPKLVDLPLRTTTSLPYDREPFSILLKSKKHGLRSPGRLVWQNNRKW